MCKLDGKDIRHVHALLIMNNTKEDRVRMPDVHPVDVFLQSFDIGCALRFFEPVHV